MNLSPYFEDVDAIYTAELVNINYLTNFRGTEAKLLFTQDEKFLFVDARYIEQAKKQTKDTTVILIDKVNLNIYEEMNKIIAAKGIKKIGFEQDRLIYQDYVAIKDHLNAQLVPMLLDDMRIAKCPDEIKIIKKACEITDKAFDYIVDTIAVGMTEAELNIKLTKFVLDQGCEGMSFTTIVASGERGALPHGLPTDRVIKENDFVTIDFGVKYEDYCSDITRTICMGEQPDPKMLEIYNTVLAAQKKAIEAVKPGMVAKNLDAVARDLITQAGYGQYFQHGLGHGVGLEIHEEPYLNTRSESVLQPGSIITIEPGIYIPELGGVRIEDDILVTKTGYEILTHAPKELIKVKRSKTK
jgi:Xaa-Pro aminopeptidase